MSTRGIPYRAGSTQRLYDFLKNGGSASDLYRWSGGVRGIDRFLDSGSVSGGAAPAAPPAVQVRSFTGMPPQLAAIAQRNLSAADQQIGAFNNRMKYSTVRVNGTSATPAFSAPANSFTMTLGGDLADQVSLDGGGSKFRTPDAPIFTQPTAPSAQANGTNSSNWRFRSFGTSQLGNENGQTTGNADTTNPGAYQTNPGAYGQQVSPVVTPSNPKGVGTPVTASPNAYNLIVSSPVVPPNYQPQDTSKHEKQYGWGSSDEEED